MPAEPVEPMPVADPVVMARAAADPDVALMLRVQAGDQAAFQELFRKFSPRILKFARRLVGNDARAEEVTQDVFLQVFRFRDRYRPESRLSTWLFTITTNFCLNDLRRPERRLRVDLWDDRGTEDRSEGPSLPDPDAITPEEGASSRELAQQLDAAIAALPPKQRAAILLSRFDGLEYRDVAAALGCTEGAVKALVFRATQSLKQTLKDYL
jgi:RNA polymerase sigma-70 factor (ECF subfamily)